MAQNVTTAAPRYPQKPQGPGYQPGPAAGVSEPRIPPPPMGERNELADKKHFANRFRLHPDTSTLRTHPILTLPPHLGDHQDVYGYFVVPEP